MTSLRIAVEGCCHGELNKIYDRILSIPEEQFPELLLVCGDFQSLRNDKEDMNSLAVPDKYKQLGDFHDYFNGIRKAPILTVFVGGNHEASNYLHELQHGGWVCENIYFLGYSNVIWYKGLRIGGWSGIYKEHDFFKPHYEKLPLNDRTVRSIYHTRFEDYLQLFMINDLNINCFISHDWPESIVHNGDVNKLLSRKPFFQKDIDSHSLGSIPSRELLKRLKPHWWFSAHLHTKFDAIVEHQEHQHKRKFPLDQDETTKKIKINNDEIDLDFDDADDEEKDSEDQSEDKNDDEIDLDFNEQEAEQQIPPVESLSKGFSQTNFLALDKCLPRRQFIEFIDIPITNQHESLNSSKLYYDVEFLKIKKWFKSFQKTEAYGELRLHNLNHSFIDQFKRDIQEVQLDGKDLSIPYNFEQSLDNSIHQTREFLTKFNL